MELLQWKRCNKVNEEATTAVASRAFYALLFASVFLHSNLSWEF